LPKPERVVLERVFNVAFQPEPLSGGRGQGAYASRILCDTASVGNEEPRPSGSGEAQMDFSDTL